MKHAERPAVLGQHYTHLDGYGVPVHPSRCALCEWCHPPLSLCTGGAPYVRKPLCISHPRSPIPPNITNKQHKSHTTHTNKQTNNAVLPQRLWRHRWVRTAQQQQQKQKMYGPSGEITNRTKASTKHLSLVDKESSLTNDNWLRNHQRAYLWNTYF